MINFFSEIKISFEANIAFEYRKVYNKLSRKYSDKELYYKIKEALYKKGFSYDDIEKEDLVNWSSF